MPRGRPESARHGLARARQPIRAIRADDGLNALDIHLLDERAQTFHARFEPVCLRDGGVECPAPNRSCVVPFVSSISSRSPNDSLRTQPTARLTRTQHARRPRRSARGQCVIRHASGLNVRRIRVCGRDLPNTWRHTQPPVWTAESLLVFSRLPSRQKDDPYDSARSVLNTSESIPAHPGRAFTTPIERPLPPRDGSLEAAPERI